MPAYGDTEAAATEADFYLHAEREDAPLPELWDDDRDLAEDAAYMAQALERMEPKGPGSVYAFLKAGGRR